MSVIEALESAYMQYGVAVLAVINLFGSVGYYYFCGVLTIAVALAYKQRVGLPIGSE
jgi:hypothetical protein